MTKNPVAEQLFDYIKDLIYDFDNAALDVELLPDDFLVLGESLVHLGDLIKEARELSRDLATGILDTNPVSTGNILARDLKILQSMLRRLAFNLEKIADGDNHTSLISYSEISVQANRIIKQLQENKENLYSESKKNQDFSESLLQANSLFEAVTTTSSQWIIVVEQSTKEWLFSNYSPTNMLDNQDAEDRLQGWIDAKASESLEFSDLNGSFGYCCDIGPDDLGISKYYRVSLYPLKWHSRSSIAFVFNDITEAKIQMDILETIAYHDELTGTFNRHKGMDILNQMIDENVPFVVSFIDLDDLKYINDVYGHSVGDNYIQTVATLLLEFDTNAIASRLGGDEFMLLAKGWNCEDATKRLEEMRTRLIETSLSYDFADIRKETHQDTGGEINRIDEDQEFYSISYGVVEVGIDNEFSASYILANADDKMYEYKRAKKLARRSS